MGAASANPIRLSASTAASEGSRRGGLDDENRVDNHDDDDDDINDNDDDSGNNDKDINYPSGDLRAYPRVKTAAFPYSRAEEKKIIAEIHRDFKSEILVKIENDDKQVASAEDKPSELAEKYNVKFDTRLDHFRRSGLIMKPTQGRPSEEKS